MGPVRGKATIFAGPGDRGVARLVLVDTKFEFGLADDGTCVLIDEA